MEPSSVDPRSRRRSGRFVNAEGYGVRVGARGIDGSEDAAVVPNKAMSPEANIPVVRVSPFPIFGAAGFFADESERA